ncbi:unnamed protein product, partial [Staurois parvus]
MRGDQRVKSMLGCVCASLEAHCFVWLCSAMHTNQCAGADRVEICIVYVRDTQ